MADANPSSLVAKSKKQRRAAMKRQRKLEERLLAEGNSGLLDPKVPLQEQSVDLPSNEEGTLEGGLEAVERREEVRRAMRRARRTNIKEKNYLKGM